MSGTNHISVLLLQLLLHVHRGDNVCTSHRIGVELIHKDEAIYRASLMMSATDSPLAVDNEPSLNGVILH